MNRMAENARLKEAKSKLLEQKYAEAITIYNEILDNGRSGSAEAAYSLAIVHLSGSGVPTDSDKAEKYFLISEKIGYPMATYRLGGLFHAAGNSSKAYAAYQKIADENPSAAYWAYRLLELDQALDVDPGAAERYLTSASNQGHVLAQKVIAKKYLSGKNGLTKIPHGVKLFIRTVINMKRAVVAGDRLMYS